VHSWAERVLCAGAIVALLACAAETDGGSGLLSVPDAGLTAQDASASAPVSDGPWDSLEARPCPEHDTLTYESFGAPFFASWCQGCHGSARGEGERQGAPREVSFDDLASVRMRAAAIWARAADDNATMPPVGGPPAEERTRLGEWLACGAPARADL
jgi:mono/diheme cytochrome c family protein